MVDFHKKADPEVAKLADQLLHTQNQHLIADSLDKAADPMKVIREMEAQAKHLNENLPKLAIDGIAEHLVREAKAGINISGEYNAMNDNDKIAVASDFEKMKSRSITVHETPEGKLASVDVETSSGVFKSVNEPGKPVQDAEHKVLDRLHIKKPF